MAINNPTRLAQSWDDDTGATATTASISPTSGGTVAVFLYLASDAGSVAGGTPAVSGLSGTFTQRRDTGNVASGGLNNRMVVWTGTGLTGTGTLSFSGLPTAIAMWEVVQITADGALSFTNYSEDTVPSAGVLSASVPSGSPACVVEGYGFGRDTSASTVSVDANYTEFAEQNYSNALWTGSAYDNASPAAPNATHNNTPGIGILVALGFVEGDPPAEDPTPTKTDIGNAANTTSAASVAVTTTAAVAVGETIFVRIACDNSTASPAGDPPTLGVSDSAGNVYTQQAISNADPGAAAAGITSALFTAPCTVALGVGGTITVSFSPNTTAKAVQCEKWTTLNNNALVLSSAALTGSTPGTAPTGSGTPDHKSQLVYVLVGTEGPTGDTFTGDADTTNGSWVTLTKAVTAHATAASNACTQGQYKVVTDAGAQSWAATITSRDWAGSILVFRTSLQRAIGPVSSQMPARAHLFLPPPASVIRGGV